jgi:ABC-2 type transport system permease protein
LSVPVQPCFAGLRLGLAGALMIASWGCESSPITSPRIEKSIASTFANLVHAQISRVGLSPLAASEISVKANCHRATGGGAGAGDWACTLVWSGPNGTLLQDTYDLFVATDGCYTAAVDPRESQLGGATLTTADGKTQRNLLYKFDGCFDTTSP